MVDQEVGRVPQAEPGSREPSPSVSAASGFDPSRWRCVFCSGLSGGMSGTTHFFGPHYHTLRISCADCKSIHQIVDGREETFERSGHPLSCGPARTLGSDGDER